MRKLWRKRWFRIIAYGSPMVVVLVLAAGWFFRIRRPQDVTAYYCLLREPYHPIWQDLALRRVGVGDSVEELRRLALPTREERFLNYTILHYAGGDDLETHPVRLVDVLAKDGRLIYADAVSCCSTWCYRFFGDVEEYRASSRLYLEYRKQRFRRENPEKYREVFGDN